VWKIVRLSVYFPHHFLVAVDVDGEADEEDGHVEERDKEINSEKEKFDEENNALTNGCSPELANGEVTTLSLLRKNGSLLQSQ
jgi:hypothetical protein